MPSLPLPAPGASASGKAVVGNGTSSVQTVLTEEIRRQQECVSACSKLCADIQDTLGASISPAITQLMGTQVKTPKAAYPEESRSGVGIALRGCKIESFLPGVPV
jgi:hypothetical protein